MSRQREPHDLLVLVVVGGLLLLALAALGILGALAFRTPEPSDLLLGALISLLSAATGALTAVLTQTGRSGGGATPADPLFMEDVGG